MSTASSTPPLPLPVPTKAHNWVRWSVQGVVVIVDPITGAPFVEDVPYSAVGSQVACHDCGEPLTDSSAIAPCEGEGGELSP